MRKRGIRFEDAATVFTDPLFALVDASGNDEARNAVIGFGATGRLLFVVHAALEGDESIRIISARAADSDEETMHAR